MLNISKGNIIKVKKGVMCPGFEKLCIEGWIGNVIRKNSNGIKTVILILWDLDTRNNMSEEYIEDSINKGLDSSLMFLEPSKLEIIS